MTTLAQALLLRRARVRQVGRFAAGPHRRARPGPRPLEPRAAEMLAATTAHAVLGEVEQALADEIAPLLGEHLPASNPHAPAVRLDAPPHRTFNGRPGPLWNRPERRRPSITETLDEAMDRAWGAARALLTPDRLAARFLRVAEEVARHTLREIRRQFRAQIGVDPISSDAGLAGARFVFVRENVERITRVAEDRVADIRRSVLEAASRGTRVEELARELEERGDMSRRRAQFVARDQVLTLNAQMARLRMQSAGVVEYEWSTSRDERVRPTHAELEGTRQRFDQPPVISEDGRTGHPGDDYLCRCVARPVLEGLIT